MNFKANSCTFECNTTTPFYAISGKSFGSPPDDNIANPGGAIVASPQKGVLPVQCKYCESGNLDFGQGKGHHAASLICEDCGRFQQWVGKSIAQQFGLVGGES
jgi:hypothetical protein